MEGWTIEDVCTFVQGLSQEFGDQASVYAAAMKKEAIDGKALLDLSAAHLEELGLSPEHRSLLIARIQNVVVQANSAVVDEAAYCGGCCSIV